MTQIGWKIHCPCPNIGPVKTRTRCTLRLYVPRMAAYYAVEVVPAISLRKAGEVHHNSTGGGAVLCMLSGDRMPVFEALESSKEKFTPLLSALGLSPRES